MRISDWSSDVCSSDLVDRIGLADHCSTARGKTWSRLDQREYGPRPAQPVGERRIVGAAQQGARKGARHHRQAPAHGFGDDRRAQGPVALTAGKQVTRGAMPGGGHTQVWADGIGSAREIYSS